MRTTIPGKTMNKCDACGAEGENLPLDFTMDLHFTMRDFQGGAVAGRSIRRDICNECQPKVIEAVNNATGNGPAIPHNAVCFFPDGNKTCAVFGDFVNLQESPAGFGDNFEEALVDLKANAAKGATMHKEIANGE